MQANFARAQAAYLCRRRFLCTSISSIQQSVTLSLLSSYHYILLLYFQQCLLFNTSTDQVRSMEHLLFMYFSKIAFRSKVGSFTSSPVFVEHTQTTAKTRTLSYKRSIKIVHEYQINTLYYTFFPLCMTVRDVCSLWLCTSDSLYVCVCVPEYRVIFSMAPPHKIFTWASIMDCDLIEAECSHHAPSVNSPHKHQLLKKPDSASFQSPKQTKALVKSVVFHTFF